MSTMTIRMSDEDAALVRKLANFEGVMISDSARTATLEKVEDSYGLHELRATTAAGDSQRFNVDEVLEEL